MNKTPKSRDEEISLKELVDRIRGIWKDLVKKWVIILFSGFLGSGIGLLYSLFSSVKYESKLSFVVEDSKAAMGGIAAIAGQLGFDIGGNAGGGIFSGDNILLFLTSESLCRETLLSGYDSAGKEILADKYAEANGLKAKWEKNEKIGRIQFSRYKDGNFPRLEDSLIQIITKKIIKKDLSVGKPDKKATFISVTVTMRDELLSKYFSERLVKIATDHYVESKTKIKSLNVAKLQRRADSLGALLVNMSYSSAATQQELVDLNPALKIVPVSGEISTRSKAMIATIFAEVVKNLEIAKVTLNQETPTIHLVDRSSLPLREKKADTGISIIAGMISAGFLCILFLLSKMWLKSQLTRQEVEPIDRITPAARQTTAAK
jgi:hypothetical protein